MRKTTGTERAAGWRVRLKTGKYKLGKKRSAK